MAVDRALEPMPLEAMEAPDDDISTEIIIESDSESGLTEITISEIPTTEAFVDHNANISEYLENDVLADIASDLVESYESDRSSRSEWESTLVEGMDILGIRLEDVTEPFDGACGAHHPMLLEACLQFQARAVSELCPADGAVKTKIIGEETPEILAQSRRVRDHMNYQITEECEEYFDEMDRMLFMLPLVGIGFKKTYYDESMGRLMSRFVPAQDFVIDNEATDLITASRYCHVLTMDSNEIRKLQVNGIYRDFPVGETPQFDRGIVNEKADEITGVTYTGYGERRRVLEFHADIDIPGFEHLGDDGEPTGIALPYVVTIVDGSNEILSIRRNYKEDDPNFIKQSWFTVYKFLPGLGFYGLGFVHVLGNLQRTATAILRSLVDAGQFANLPGGFKARGMRVAGDTPVSFGEFRDVEGVGDDIRKSIIPLPTKEPSQTLFLLLGNIIDNGRRLSASTDLQVGDANTKETPVGSVVAMMEAGQRLMSTIHRRLHRAQRNEFRLMARINNEYADFSRYTSGSGEIYAEDYDGRVDVVPVSDPNVFSESQRIMRAQAQLQLAQQFPMQHDLPAAIRNMHETIGTENIDDVLLPDRGPLRADPATENFSFMHGKAAKAFADQDHQSHIATHQAFMMSMQGDQQTFAKLSPVMNAHIAEHMAHSYRQQIESMMQQPLPAAPDYNPMKPMDTGEYTELPVQIENELARMQAMAGQQLAQQQAQLQQAQQNQQLMQNPQVQLAMQKLAIDKQEADVKAYKAQTDVALKQAELQAEINDDELDRQLEAEKAELDAQVKLADQKARVDAAAMNVSRANR